VLEHGRAVSGDVFVEQDSCLGIAQKPCQCRLAVEKRMVAQILTVVLDQIKGV